MVVFIPCVSAKVWWSPQAAWTTGRPYGKLNILKITRKKQNYHNVEHMHYKVMKQNNKILIMH